MLSVPDTFSTCQWTNPLKDLTQEIDTVQLHHPDQIVWTETAGVTDAV